MKKLKRRMDALKEKLFRMEKGVIVQSFSLSPSHHPDMTEILLKGCKCTNTNPSFNPIALRKAKNVCNFGLSE